MLTIWNPVERSVAVALLIALQTHPGAAHTGGYRAAVIAGLYSKIYPTTAEGVGILQVEEPAAGGPNAPSVLSQTHHNTLVSLLFSPVSFFFK